VNETALRNRAIVLLFAGTLVAGVTAWTAWRVLSTYQRELVAARHPEDRVEVAVAVHDIASGQALTKGDLELREVDADAAPADDVFHDLQPALGQVVQSPVLQGEILRRQRLVETAAGSALAAVVSPGMRAVSVTVDRAAGVAGKLRRGDHVDVIVTLRPDGDGADAVWVTETILQGARVLDDGEPVPVPTPADGHAPPKAPVTSEPRTVTMTLELAPEEAEKLAMASARGELRIALRGRDDLAILEQATPLVATSLMGVGARPSAERAPRPSVRPTRGAPAPAGEPALVSAEVIQGSDSLREHFDPDGRRQEIPHNGR
jgi:pilus assembly protein CpaB